MASNKKKTNTNRLKLHINKVDKVKLSEIKKYNNCRSINEALSLAISLAYDECNLERYIQ